MFDALSDRELRHLDAELSAACSLSFAIWKSPRFFEERDELVSLLLEVRGIREYRNQKATSAPCSCCAGASL